MKDLTKGSPIKLILSFSLPIFIGYILQLFYNIVDTRIVGSALGESSLASVASTTSLSDLMVTLITGSINGFSIIIATNFGAKKEDGVKKATAGTFLLGVLLALLLSVITLLFLQPILHLLNVPKNLVDEASSYIRVIMAGLVFTALYNCCAASLRAIGDTITPLIFLAISSILNIFLDCFLVIILKMGVSGASVATVISQAISFFLCFIYLWKKYEILHFDMMDFKPEGQMLSNLLGSGISMGLMNSLVTFGTVSLQTVINTFGSQIIVAHVAARKIQSICMTPFPVFGQALATYCGQNMGAGEYGRIKKGLKDTIIVTFCWDLCVILISYTICGKLVTLITASTDSVVISNAVAYMRFDSLFYFVSTLICLIRNSMQGFGDHITPIFSSFIEMAGKILIAIFLAPKLGYLGIIISEPIVWFLMVIPLIIQLVRNPIMKKQSTD